MTESTGDLSSGHGDQLRLAEQLVIETMARADVLSRSDLAARTQLPRSTLVSAIASLLARGLVSETDELAKGPGAGRPSHQIRLTLADKRLMFVDLSDRSAQLRIATCRGDLQGSSSTVDGELYTELSSEGSSGEFDLARASRFLIEMAHEHEVDAVIVAVSGSAKHLPKGGALSVGSVFPSSGPSGIPIAVESYADLAALGEAWFGATKSATSAVFISTHHVFGLGMTLDGRFLRSGAVTSSDLRSLALERDSEWRVLRNDELTRATPLDPLVEQAAVSLGRAVGETVSNLVTILEPGTIIVDGALANAGGVVASALSAELGYRARSDTHQLPRVVVSALGGDAAALGAVALFRDRRLSQLAPAFHTATSEWLEPPRTRD